jgi:hypothetical protein
MEQSRNSFIFTPITGYSLKTIKQITIQTNNINSQSQSEMAPQVLFYSPNRMPDDLAKIDNRENEKLKTHHHHPIIKDFRRFSLLNAPSSLKFTTSVIDLPSKFPTEVEGDDTFDGMMNSDERMVRSSIFTSSITEECVDTEQIHNADIESNPSSRFNLHNRRLSKLFTNLRQQIERTKSALKASLNDELKLKMPTSRSFPIASSTSMISLENYWRKSIWHKQTTEAAKVNYL